MAECEECAGGPSSTTVGPGPVLHDANEHEYARACGREPAQAAECEQPRGCGTMGLFCNECGQLTRAVCITRDL